MPVSRLASRLINRELFIASYWRLLIENDGGVVIFGRAEGTITVGRKCNRRPVSARNSGALLGMQMFPVCALPRLILSTVNSARSNAWEDEGIAREGTREEEGKERRDFAERRAESES